jgi:hypothetical protein
MEKCGLMEGPRVRWIESKLHIIFILKLQSHAYIFYRQHSHEVNLSFIVQCNLVGGASDSPTQVCTCKSLTHIYIN